jgi:adenosine kinase
MNIVVTGSLGYDYIMDFNGVFAERIMPDKIHKISFAPLVDTLTKQMGGIAGNIGYSLKLLGVEPLIVACAGNDFEVYEQHLQKNTISTKYIVRKADVVSGTYFVMTDKEDNQIGGYYKGALLYNSELSLQSIQEHIDLVVIAANEPKAMKQHVDACTAAHLPYMYDPAFQIGDFTKEELQKAIIHAAICIGNDYEIALMEKKLGVPHEKFRLLAPILITTLGAKGSVIETGTKVHTIKAAKAKNTSDPTGAGDAYRAGFLAGFVRGFDLQTCGQMGSVAAVYAVETYGTQTHTYTETAFCKRYKENYNSEICLAI